MLCEGQTLLIFFGIKRAILNLQGCKQLLGKECHDYPQVPHIYKDVINFKKTYVNHYGNGISYTNLLEKELHNNDYDNNIEELIKNKNNSSR